MSLGCGTAPGAKDIAGQRAVLPAWRDSERTGDCPLGRASTMHRIEDADVRLSRRIQNLQHKRNTTIRFRNTLQAIPHFAALGNEVVVTDRSPEVQ